MSMRQAVSCDARRTFWPFLPIASDSLSSGTISSMRWPSASMITRFTSAGGDRVAPEAGRIVVVRHDVDLLAAQLLHDGLHAAALHADARADRIDVAIARRHGDLRARARLAGRALDADDLLVDLRDLLLEQLLEQALV